MAGGAIGAARGEERLTAASDLPSLYAQRPITLWVEDEETRGYLDTVWQDNDIGFLIAGGATNVGAVVKSAREDGFSTVFGVRDRDFGRTNRSRWESATHDMSVFATESLELENLALDEVAIAASDANTANLTPPAILQLLSDAASRMLWYMACRHAISDLRDATIREFIEHPKAHGPNGVATYEEARDRILGSAWWREVLPVARRTVTESSIEIALGWHHHFFQQMLADGRWRARFSGKEILDAAINSIWRTGRTRGPRRDLVVMVARAQRSLRRIPEEAAALHRALRSRAGMPPRPLT